MWETKYIILAMCSVLFMLIMTALLVKHLIDENEKEKEYNKRIILFNRRTKKLKEVLNRNYVENKSWEEVVTIYNNVFREFVRYLRRDDTLNAHLNYTRRPCKGVAVLRWKFKKFIDEVSKIKN